MMPSADRHRLTRPDAPSGIWKHLDRSFLKIFLESPEGLRLCTAYQRAKNGSLGRRRRLPRLSSSCFGTGREHKLKRFILAIVGPGEILGLSSAVSGFSYEMRAESHFPREISSLPRQSFLDFLVRYPIACQNVARQLSRQYKHTFEQLRTLGFTLNAPAKLARLLLDWCAEGARTANGTWIQCPYTRAEIGEHIGVSRETITRCLRDFTTKGLLRRRGTTFIVPSH